MSFGPNKSDSVAQTIATQKVQRKGILITAEFENPLQVEWKKVR